MRILPVIALLALATTSMARATSGTGATAPPPSTDPAALRAAATKAIALVQQSVAIWDRKQTCFSCHHQGLALSTLQSARAHGVPFDEAAARASTAKMFRSIGNVDLAVQAVQQIDPAMMTAMWLANAQDAGLRPTLATAVYARTIANRQEADGHWRTIDARPPQAGSLVTATALAVRAVQQHLTATQFPDRSAVVERARAWLRAVTPQDTEERTFQLFGLSWSGETTSMLRARVEAILAEQRPDGGWSQLPGRGSDAYATGQTLVALSRAGTLPTSDAAWQKGLRYLLTTQRPDGSWRVHTRVHEQDLVSPPYFETGFPHGHDQFISCMATTWATMALMEALPLVMPGATVLAAPQSLSTQLTPAPTAAEATWMQAALFGSRADLTALLDGGLDASTHTTRGTTLLMMAAHDPDKVRLLLSRGADPRAVSQARHTALMIAANARGALESMRLLLDAGASPVPLAAAATASGAPARPTSGPSPMLYAIWSGEVDKVTLLLDRGAPLPRRMNVGAGALVVTPLELAIFLHDVRMATWLIARGADVNELGETGITPLSSAILGDDVTMARALLELGASVNLADQQGETALMHAAQIDFGNVRVIDALLAAGADRAPRSPDKLSALDLATKYGHAAMIARLQGR